jgi:hypothetical protein
VHASGLGWPARQTHCAWRGAAGFTWRIQLIIKILPSAAITGIPVAVFISLLEYDT